MESSVMEKIKYVLLAAVIYGAYMLVRITGLQDNLRAIQCTMLVMIWMLCMFLLSQRKSVKLSDEDICKVIIIAGMIMRIGYMLYTGADVRSHDLGEFSVDARGHAGYILTLINGNLPQTNELQFYQQPFFYILGSAVSKSVNVLLGCSDPYYLVDATKLVSCFASCGVLFVAQRLCRICRLKGNSLLIAMCIIAFMPDFYLTGGRVNCDALVAFLILLALLYTFYWYQNPSWKYTIILALIYGCAVMTKISCSALATFTATIFVYKLVREIREKTSANGELASNESASNKLASNKVGRLILKLIVFGVISLPLGLWYSVRNYLLFKQPLLYVLDIPQELDIYTGDISLFSRFIYIDVKNLLQTPYANAWGDYNIPVYYLKSSLFGEFQYSIMGWIPVLLLFAALIVAVIAVTALISQVRHNRNEKRIMAMFFVLLLYYGSMLMFNIKYPFGCSMDYRYIVFLTVLMAIVLAKYYSSDMPLLMKRITVPAVICFSALSCIMYMLIG